MPHSLKVRLKNLRYKGLLSEKDVDRIISALEQNERAEGKWIETEYHRWRCSVCREKGMSDWDNIHNVRTDFCPNCGAIMVEPREKRCADCNHYGKLSLDCGRCDDDCSMYEPQESE